MPDYPTYKTGARKPAENEQCGATNETSPAASENNLSAAPSGKSEPVDDLDEENTHLDEQRPPFQGSPSPSTEQIAGAGPAIAERSKDAHTSVPNRQPGAYVEDDPLPNRSEG